MELRDLKNVIIKGGYMKINDENLACINGGAASVSATLLNYFSKAVTTIFDVGHSLGGAIRRIATNNVCPM